MYARTTIFAALFGVILMGLVHGAEPRRDSLRLPDPEFKGKMGGPSRTPRPISRNP